MARERMEYDVIIVGAGPSGLATSIKLAQINTEKNLGLSIAVLEKGSEIGAHILSGAVIEPKALTELFPDWEEQGAPLKTKVAKDDIRILSEKSSIGIPDVFAPAMRNHGNYVASLGNLCRWLGEKAMELGVEIFPGFAAAELLYEQDRVIGVITGDMGVSASGEQKGSYVEGIELCGKVTVLSEGCRGHLGKQLIEKFNLDEGQDPQHYGIGLKEVWRLKPENHQPGLVMHTTGWPSQDTASGSFFYHAEDLQCYIGYVVPLNYENPLTSPYDEFQTWKHHPRVASMLEGGERLAYGARALIKGGPQSRPRMHAPGALLIGDDAGTLNFAKIKGSHTAMKSGMVAAEVIAQALSNKNNTNSEQVDSVLETYDALFAESWAGKELHKSRNFGPLLHKLGSIIGAAVSFVEYGIFQGALPLTLRDTTPDHATLKPVDQVKAPTYTKPDGILSFDKLSSVFLSNTNHEEDQPCHLQLLDEDTPIRDNLPTYDEPAQRYCPAGVYEVMTDESGAKFVINGQNCVHCKTCDIKDPAQNIRWVTPEGGGGPNYPNM